MILLFPAHESRPATWARADGTAGEGFATALPGERIVLVAPGEAVALHWIELPALAPNQARAAARLAAADVVAAPLDALHVAVAPGAGVRPMAVVAIGALADWLAQAQAAGLDPHHVVPEPLLLVAPAEGELHWPRAGRVVVRGAAAGHVAEPALATLLGEGPVRVVDDAEVAAGLEALETIPLDLRQGRFARRRRWSLDWQLVRRQGVLAALILLTTLTLQIVRIVRYDLAARDAAAQAAAAARAVLPRATRIADPVAQLDARLAELRGGGLGFPAMAGLVIGALRETGGVELTAMTFDGTGQLTATVSSADQAEIDALVRRIGADGLAVSAGAARPGGGRLLADITVTAR